MNDNLVHFVRMKDVYKLETIFARLTDDGWIIPEWLILMRRTCIL